MGFIYHCQCVKYSKWRKRNLNLTRKQVVEAVKYIYIYIYIYILDSLCHMSSQKITGNQIPTTGGYHFSIPVINRQ